MKTSLFCYPLPERLIAQHPAEKRGTEKMMVLHRSTGVLEHRHIYDIADYMEPGDLLVVNDTKVFPARLIGEWPDTHGAVEVLLVAPAPEEAGGASQATGDGECDGNPSGQGKVQPATRLEWNCIVGSGRKCREAQTASFGPNGELKATLIKPLGGIGMWRVRFEAEKPLMELLDEFGHTPVPPYVKREGTKEEEAADRERYQTIYAKHVGSVAAPTAGLHFTPEILAKIEEKGVKRVAVTLHVGPGTFRPVKAANIEEHEMDFEAFDVPPETADAINECKARGGRVFCCGSTTVRTLETVAAANGGKVVAGSGASNIFIYPPYKFAVTDCMLTNFHLPQSTLLMMISALAGRERVLCAYAMAVKANYMFFSYGDCMLIV
ncbi:MAG: tRNA preQ1(34) S-adenosylmethionine ribosyltransferase-isomerase QueA [Kiritimatiellae bacterium]|nr:tRNA preQ1(34) S-adenosylmethionine ribosyltransferase-isomerase QueA [Kiritimatiellia bacterium]